MTGLDHYQAAEANLRKAMELGPAPDDEQTALLATAQLHATLALAAATALGSLLEGEEAPSKERMKWSAVVL